MTVTVMKTRFKKHPPKVILYRDYKRFSNTIFHAELQYMLIEQHFYHSSNDDFVDMTMRILKRHAPLKQKYIRANNAPFMTKELRKAIMNRSKLKNKSNSVNTREAHHEYKKQRNLCTYLLKKAKKDYYSNLNPKTITDNKKFWKTVKPLFSDKSIAKETITLVENDEIFRNEQLLAEKFNEFFSTAVT